MKPLLAFLLLASTAMADNCHIVRKQAFVLDTGLTIVPFAVATPVAVVAPGSPVYSYRGPQAYQAAQPQVDPAEWAAFQAWKRQQGTVNALSVSLVQKNCAACHAKDGDAKDHWDASGELTADMKLAAIAAVMTGEMPKSKTLDPQVRADIVAELSGATPKGESK